MQTPTRTPPSPQLAFAPARLRAHPFSAVPSFPSKGRQGGRGDDDPLTHAVVLGFAASRGTFLSQPVGVFRHCCCSSSSASSTLGGLRRSVPMSSRNPYTATQISPLLTAVYGLRDETGPETSRNPYTADKNCKKRSAVYGFRDHIPPKTPFPPGNQLRNRHQTRSLSSYSHLVSPKSPFWREYLYSERGHVSVSPFDSRLSY